MLPKLIILVRHAQSEHHVKQLTGGWTDTPLTTLGHQQAERLARRLQDDLAGTEVALYTSDLQRAAQTAHHIGEALGVTPALDRRIREWNNGQAVGMTLDEARQRFPGAFDVPWKIDDRPFPGGETGRELYERAGGFVTALCRDGSVPVIVSHGAAIECIVARWLRLTPDTLEPIGFAAHPTGVTVLALDRFERPLIERLNDISHLRGSESWTALSALQRL